LSLARWFNATRVCGWRHIPADLASKSSELRSLAESLSDEQYQGDARDLLRASVPSFSDPGADRET
jgi:hypothetical protein